MVATTASTGTSRASSRVLFDILQQRTTTTMSKSIEKPATHVYTTIKETPSGELPDFVALWIVGAIDVEGELEGAWEGEKLGTFVGEIVGWIDGMGAGDMVGIGEGLKVGDNEGIEKAAAGLSQIYRVEAVQDTSFQSDDDKWNKITQSSLFWLLLGSGGAKLRYKDVPCEHWNDPSVEMSFKQDQTLPTEP
jgi:hypothetical protein